MINFPINPNIGLEYTDQNTGITWVWTGETWDFVCDVEGSTPLPTTTYIGINPIDVSVFVDQLGNKTVTVSHLESGVIPGSYNRIVVDKYGHIISATNERSGHIIQDTGVNMPDRLHLDFRRMIVRDNPLLNSTEVIRPPSVFVGTDPPTYELLPGDEWIDSSTWKKYIWYGDYWVETGKIDCYPYTPIGGGGGTGGGDCCPPVDNSYSNTTLMISDQSNQEQGFFYFDGLNYWEYLGTTNNNLSDYRRVTVESFSLPAGLEGQVYKILEENSSVVTPQDNILVGNYITNDFQLEDSKGIDGIFTSFQDIFNTWRRFSHGKFGAAVGIHLGPGDDLPANPLATTYWVYDSSTDQIRITINSGTYVGFISPKKYSQYDHRATMTSTSADNDVIAIVIAFVEDPNDLILNRAFGLDPVTYKGLNVTDEYIPNQHTISLIRARENFVTRYGIVYDFLKTTEKVLVDGSSLVWSTNTNWSSRSVDVRVVRNGDQITVFTSQFSDAPGGKGALGFGLQFNLNDDIDTLKFRGGSNYGYSSYSQQNTTFRDVSIVGIGQNEIYDHRNGDIWTANSLGEWSVDSERTLWDTLLKRSITFNPRYSELVWHSEPEIFDILSTDDQTSIPSWITAVSGYNPSVPQYFTHDDSGNFQWVNI
jgi:hypothetical protein